MRILLTGSRHWTDEGLLWDVLSEYRPERGGLMHTVILVHGNAPGADRLASLLWCANDGWEESHPADWTRYGKAAGPLRNQQMVDLGADLCLAFPLGVSTGTRDCMRRATKAGIPVINHGDVLA